MTLVEKDIASLRRSARRSAKAAAVFGVAACLALLVLGFVRLRLSWKYAGEAGMTCREVLAGWFTESTPGVVNNGSRALAADTARSGVFLLLAAGLIAFATVFRIRRIRRDERLMRFIERAQTQAPPGEEENRELKEKLKSLGYLG